jgi:hypothetical protein
MDKRLDPARDIDWEGDFTWVQRSPVLTVLERSASWVHLRHPAGGEFTMSRNEAERDFLPVRDGTMLKPRYAPVKAHCPRVEAAVELPCGTVRLGPGDVLLNDNGRFRVVGSAVFDRDYVAIACPSAVAPARRNLDARN